MTDSTDDVDGLEDLVLACETCGKSVIKCDCDEEYLDD